MMLISSKSTLNVTLTFNLVLTLFVHLEPKLPYAIVRPEGIETFQYTDTSFCISLHVIWIFWKFEIAKINKYV